jgi:two-component sensor histidine kinase
VIQTALEYTCSLKDLAYGSCFRRYRASIEVLADFGPGLPTLAGTSIEPGDGLLAALGSETTEHEIAPGEPMPPHLPRDAHAHYGAVRGWCCVPIEGRGEHLWMVLADAREGSARLGRMAPLIERVRDVVQTRMETLALIEDIRNLNQGLERRVEERTRELARAYEMIKDSEAGIRRSLEEKVILLREINHRVKNNMQVAASLIRMQKKEMRDPHDRSLLENTLDRIQAMAMVYDKLSASEDFVHVDAGRLARSVAMNVVQSRRGWSGTKLGLDVEDLAFSVDVAMPFGLLLAELTAQALGREGTTEVGVSLACADEGSAVLTVSDNSPLTNGGPHQPEPGSLGEIMTETLREQMQATVEETIAHGTRSVRVSFPLPLYRTRI